MLNIDCIFERYPNFEFQNTNENLIMRYNQVQGKGIKIFNFSHLYSAQLTVDSLELGMTKCRGGEKGIRGKEAL